MHGKAIGIQLGYTNKALAEQNEELFKYRKEGDSAGGGKGLPEPSPSSDIAKKQSPSDLLHSQGTKKGNDKKAKLNPALHLNCKVEGVSPSPECQL